VGCKARKRRRCAYDEAAQRGKESACKVGVAAARKPAAILFPLETNTATIDA
jgi:hypothetical protein